MLLNSSQKEATQQSSAKYYNQNSYPLTKVAIQKPAQNFGKFMVSSQLYHSTGNVALKLLVVGCTHLTLVYNIDAFDCPCQHI